MSHMPYLFSTLFTRAKDAEELVQWLTCCVFGSLFRMHVLYRYMGCAWVPLTPGGPGPLHCSPCPRAGPGHHGCTSCHRSLAHCGRCGSNQRPRRTARMRRSPSIKTWQLAGASSTPPLLLSSSSCLSCLLLATSDGARRPPPFSPL